MVIVTADLLPPTAYGPFEAVASRVVRVRAAGAFARRGTDAFEVDPADPASLRLLLDALAKDGADLDLDGVEWVQALPLSIVGPVGPGTLARARHACLDTTAALVQALSDRTGSPRVWWLSYGARPVAGGAAAGAGAPGRTGRGRPAGGRPPRPLAGPPRRRTHPLGGTCGLARGRNAPTPPGRSRRPGPVPAARAPAGLLVATGHHAGDSAGGRTLELPGDDAVHLVLGGTGGIGRAIAAWLLEHTGGRVLLLSRKPVLPVELTRWAHRVDLVAADLATTPAHEVASAVAGHTERLDGVIHAAGAGFGGLLVRRDAAAMREAAAARENGALVVEHLIQRYRPALAVYCSSMSALLGGVGQCDYAAGAGLLDNFAHYRAETETTARIGIDWDVWRETGMATRMPAADSRHRAHLKVGLTVQEGTAVFARAVSSNCRRCSSPPQASRRPAPSTPRRPGPDEGGLLARHPGCRATRTAQQASRTPTAPRTGPGSSASGFVSGSASITWTRTTRCTTSAPTP
ncbi:SDR family NAD(P)-dependent oxidoreductase [Streptomyces sp. M10(2022)]